MKRTLTTLAAFAMGLTMAHAGEVSPGDVVFDGYEIAASLTEAPGNAERGRNIMTSKSIGNCVSCHAAQDYADVPFHGEVGPVLDGAGDRWSEAELRGIVVNAKMAFDGTIMPSFYKVDGFIRPGKAYTGKAADDTFGPLLSAQEIEDVVAYLLTLKES
ncbi:MAG: sulfur oxidation c-type cytochrome SoxX [Maritimibacter sp.]